MLISPIKKKTYKLKINEADFINRLENLLQISKGNYYGFFADPDKPYRGKINKKLNTFHLRRNLGASRGFDVDFIGNFTSENETTLVKIEIKPSFFSWLLFFGMTIFLVALLSLDNQEIITILASVFIIYLFFFLYLKYEIFMRLAGFSEYFEKTIVASN